MFIVTINPVCITKLDGVPFYVGQNGSGVAVLPPKVEADLVQWPVGCSAKSVKPKEGSSYTSEALWLQWRPVLRAQKMEK
jgi:hypothetical protein